MLLNNNNTLKSTDNATLIKLGVVDENQEFIDLTVYKRIDVTIGKNETLYSTIVPQIVDKTTLQFANDGNIPHGKYSIQVNLVNNNDTVHVVPNRGDFPFTIEKSLNELGETVTLMSVQELISSMEDVKTISKDSNNKVTQAIQTAETVQSQFNQIVANSDSNPEVVQARGGEVNLNTRLDKVTTQLADTAQDLEQRGVNVKQPPFNVKGNGVDDDTVAIQTAADYAFSLGTDSKLIIPRGNYKITGKVMIKCQLDATQATLEYYGTGTALVIGDDTASNRVTARKRFELPRVVNKSRGTAGWDGTSIGVMAVNLNTCEVYVPFIQDFEKGLVVYGLDGGTAYATFYLGSLWENHKNLVLDNTPSGYVNQNLFLNGRLQHSTTKGAILDDVNANQVLIAGMNTKGPNNNTFINTSFEGETVSYYRVDIAGSYNQFYNCRWETPNNATFRVRYRSSANNNRIDGGYGSVNMVEVFEGTLGGGAIFDHFGGYASASATAGQIIPNNVWTVINSWSTPITRRVSYNATTGEFTPRPGRWRINATVTFAPNTTGRRISRLNTAGSVIDINETPANANRFTMKLQGVFNFNGTQTFKIECNQTSGTDLALETTSPYVRVQAEYLGV